MRKVKNVAILERTGAKSGELVAICEDGSLWLASFGPRFESVEVNVNEAFEPDPYGKRREWRERFVGMDCEWQALAGPPDGDPGTQRGMTIEEQAELLRERGSGSVGSLTRRSGQS